MEEELALVPTRTVRGVREFVNGLAKWFAGHRQLQNVAISGEVSGLREFGGNLSFSLKEETAILNCVMWSEQRRGMPELREGTKIVATGSVRIRLDRSGFQLQVDAVELTGIGELFALHQRLKEKFAREGLFEAQRKRAVPELPLRIAVVSARGKGAEDFVGTLARSVPFVAVRFIESRVQGQGAEIDVADAIDQAGRSAPDLVVVTRGGGSYEDLFPFNLEPVIRAIVRAGVPVVTAIGHSGDHHLADDVADATFGTPSLAAEHIAKSWANAISRLRNAKRELLRGLRNVLGTGQHRIDLARRDLARAATAIATAKRHAFGRVQARLEAQSPQSRIADWRARTTGGAARLDRFFAATIAARERRMHECAGRLKAAAVDYPHKVRGRLQRAQALLDRVDPLAPLERGYAIVSKDGAALRDAASLKPGETVSTRLLHGTFESRVESIGTDE